MAVFYNMKQERREALSREQIGVREEVSRLRQTLSWGPAGVEAVLATLIPEAQSLFFGKMDVLAARRQYDNFELLLNQHGCEVIQVRDLAVPALMENGGDMPAMSLEELKERIMLKAVSLVKRYGRGIGQMDEGSIEQVLIEDAEKYGEEGAIRLNAILAQVDSEALPMANLLFGRDQCNLVDNVLFWSNMAHEIRKPEVDLWMMATESLFKNIDRVVVDGDGRLEGGDTIAHNGDCLVGVGGRSNLAGVAQIAPEILKRDLRLFAVYHPERDAGQLEHQTTMHLDTFRMTGPKNTEVVLMEEAQERLMLEVSEGSGGDLRILERGSFASYLWASEADIIPLTREQQLGYQANFVVLDENTVLLTVGGDGYLKKEFEKRGITVVDGKMDAITQGYGGAHCSLTPILRI